MVANAMPRKRRNVKDNMSESDKINSFYSRFESKQVV